MAESLKREFPRDDMDRANVYVRKGSALPVIRDVQMKTTLNYASQSEGCHQKEGLVRVWGKRNNFWWQCELLQPPWGERHGGSSKN